MYALKLAGVTHVFASNAVGSLREDLSPGTLVVPDQIYDRTKRRPLSFYGDGIVVHQPFAEPYSPSLVDHLTDAARSATDTDVVRGGTYVCIEGPQYSTRAESAFYRDHGWDLVGMTAIPEAKLAREAEIAYATIAGVTDYDVWKTDSEVTLHEVLENAEANQTAIKAAVEEAVRTLPADHECAAHSALEGTINTPTEAIPEATRDRVEPLVGAYL
jgi:5'-methylthioadenosine phosphorylase